MRKFLNWLRSLFAPKQVAAPEPIVTPPPVEVPKEEVNAPKLSWERYPENRPWSEHLFKAVQAYMPVFETAKDLNRIHPEWKILSDYARVHVICELISSMAYFESGWNERSAGVDVGVASNRDTWSVGLLQVSVVDQKNMGIPLKYTYAQLLTAIPNLNLTLEILARQIRKTGLFILPNSSPQRYWAVLLDGNKYSKVREILSKVQSAI